MIRLVVTDVDGTIVGKDEVLHEEMVSYVKLVKEKGIQFTIATGRPKEMAEKYVKQLGLDIPYIACNGGMLIKDGTLLSSKTMALSELQEVFKAADGLGMSLLSSIDGMERAYRKTPYVREQQELYGRYLNPAAFTEEEWETVRPDKVFVMAAVRDGSIGAVERLCQKLPPSFSYKRYGDKAIDILPREATKENALRKLAASLNLTMDQVLFVGDDLNDVEAILEAGVGVAVANAQPAAKEQADYITKERCYLGVMEAVDRFTGAAAWKSAMDNSLRRQSYSLPDLLLEQFMPLKERISGLFTRAEANGIRQIVLTGCGDSYAAGLTLRYGLEELSGLPVELVTAMDFSRYYSRKRLSGETLVIGISISGSGVRMKEAMDKAASCNAMTLAMTKYPDSDMGKPADKVLTLSISPFEEGPGNRNYFTPVLGLLILGIVLGELRGVHDAKKTERFYGEILKQGQELKRLLPQMDGLLFELARKWKSMKGFDFVGSGMEYGSAWLGHAKMIEITGAFAMHINSEDWFHMNNFVKDIGGCPTIFVASVKAAGFSRTREAVSYAKKLGRPLAVITDGDQEDFGEEAFYIKVPHSDFWPAMALTQYVPICILAGYMGAMLGEKNCRGCLGPWSFAAGGRFLSNSRYAAEEGGGLLCD